MFDLSLDEEQLLIRNSAQQFARERVAPGSRTREAAGQLEASLHTQYRELGLGLVELPDALDGADLGALARVLALEALAGADAGALADLDRPGPVSYPLLEFGSDQGRAQLKPLIDQDQRGWVLVDDTQQLSFVDGHVQGQWPWLPASHLDLLVVLQPGAAHVITEGLSLTPTKPCALHASGSASLALDGPVLHSFEDDGRAGARSRARLRLYAASALVGVAAATLDYARDYTQQRIAFGRPVAHHQGIAFLIAELATNLDGARLSCWRAGWALAQQGDPTEACAQAFLEAADSALACGEQGVQLLGGHGYMQDHLSEKWMREARTLAQLWGGRDGAIDALSEQLPTTSKRVGFALPEWQPAKQGGDHGSAA